MEIVYDENHLETYISKATDVSEGKPILIDKYLDNAIEIDVDALSDGKDVYIALSKYLSIRIGLPSLTSVAFEMYVSR